MKKGFIKVFLLFILVFSLAACDKKELRGYKLKVIETSWSGSSEDYDHEERTTEYDIILNKKYIVSRGSLGLTFTIMKINKDKIYIKTSNRFSNQANGINLRSNKTKFMIKKDKVLALTTPTMDAGNIYYLSIEKK